MPLVSIINIVYHDNIFGGVMLYFRDKLNQNTWKVAYLLGLTLIALLKL